MVEKTSISSVDTSESENYDSLKLRNDSSIKKKLALDEKVVLSAIVNKINKRTKKQERTLLITNKAIYNVDSQGLLSFLGSSVKRKIDFMKIHGITVSEISNEFVIHVPSEYDYRYSSNDKRDLILLLITKYFYESVPTRKLVFYFKDVFELTPFTTTEDDMKKGVSKIPKDGGVELTEEGLAKAFALQREKKADLNAKTEKVFSKDTGMQKVTLDDFNLLKVLGRGAFGKVMLVEKKDTKQVYALKSLRKDDIIDKEQVEHTKTERYVLEKSNSPFLVTLEYAFQTPEKIFFVMGFKKFISCSVH